MKEFRYARANAGEDRRASKLLTSKRINCVDAVGPLAGATGSIAATISQSYRYAAMAPAGWRRKAPMAAIPAASRPAICMLPERRPGGREG